VTWKDPRNWLVTFQIETLASATGGELLVAFDLLFSAGQAAFIEEELAVASNISSSFPQPIHNVTNHKMHCDLTSITITIAAEMESSSHHTWTGYDYLSNLNCLASLSCRTRHHHLY
jgi:hypothetical protein